jgi:hypothetical protein
MLDFARTTAVAVFFLLAQGCASAAEPAEGALARAGEGEVHANVGSASLASTPCSGSYCQDAYTEVWCTDYEATAGWDYRSCTWTGWNNPSGVPTKLDVAGTVYCYKGIYVWGQAHLHCP